MHADGSRPALQFAIVTIACCLFGCSHAPAPDNSAKPERASPAATQSATDASDASAPASTLTLVATEDFPCSSRQTNPFAAMGRARVTGTIESVPFNLEQQRKAFEQQPIAMVDRQWRLHEAPNACFTLSTDAGVVPKEGTRVELTFVRPDCSSIQFVGCRNVEVVSMKLAPM